jgi:Cd(II)/Pb(II)-responsive transcriptional regulator
MVVSELSKITEVDGETIRYYEKIGLLPKPARKANGYRDYDQVHVERLAFIRYCRELDMPLSDIRRLLDYIQSPDAGCSEIKKLVSQQLTRVNSRLKALQVLQKQLIALDAECNSENIARDCGILRDLVEGAGHKLHSPTL